MDNKKRYKIEKIKYLNYIDDIHIDSKNYDCHFCNKEHDEANFTVSEKDNMHYICQECADEICNIQLQTDNDKKKCFFCEKKKKKNYYLKKKYNR